MANHVNTTLSNSQQHNIIDAVAVIVKWLELNVSPVCS